MEKYQLTPLEREVCEEMAQLNPGNTPEMFYKGCTKKLFRYFADHGKPLVDISPLSQLKDLCTVEICCSVCDLSPLDSLQNLKGIKICSALEILPCDLTSLKNLEYLYIHSDHCTVPNLEGLPKLFLITLNGVDCLDGLAGLKSLEYLHISENTNLSDLSPLASCPGLVELEAHHTGVSDLSPLAGHPNLKHIGLSNTKVMDIFPLSTIITLESIYLYGTAVTDVSCLASLPNLSSLNLLKTQVADLSAFQGRENILAIEQKKLGIKKAGKDPAELKIAIEEIRQRLEKMGITPRPPLQQDTIRKFQERTGIKLPKEYTAFLTKIGDGFEGWTQSGSDSVFYEFPTLKKLKFDPEGVSKRFSHREGWCWEDDEKATSRKIDSATQNGQIELIDCGCGRSYSLIVCGGAKGEVWNVTDVGVFPYGNRLDFLDWMKDYLDGKAK